MSLITNLRIKRRSALFALSFASLLAAGCGADGDGKTRVALEGEIKLNGKALPSGLVSFLPSDEKGTATVAKIENGKYTIERVNGPALGTYKVLINSRQPTGKKVRDVDNPAQLVNEEREVIPLKYNSESTLTIEIKEDGKQNFDLKGNNNYVASLTKKRSR